MMMRPPVREWLTLVLVPILMSLVVLPVVFVVGAVAYRLRDRGPAPEFCEEGE